MREQAKKKKNPLSKWKKWEIMACIPYFFKVEYEQKKLNVINKDNFEFYLKPKLVIKT
jgi:hypothetical protein